MMNSLVMLQMKSVNVQKCFKDKKACLSSSNRKMWIILLIRMTHIPLGMDQLL